MKMDVYSVINEAKDSKLFSIDEVKKLYSLANGNILLKIVAAIKVEKKDDKIENSVSDMAEIIIKDRDEYWKADDRDELPKFTKELVKKIKKKIKKDRKKVKRELFKKIDNIADNFSNTFKKSEENSNNIIYKLFLNDYNSKYAYTWKAFKETKRLYEKSHPFVGNNLYSLKAILEKDPKIEKVVDSTVFSKSNHTLSKDTLELIQAKLD